MLQHSLRCVSGKLIEDRAVLLGPLAVPLPLAPALGRHGKRLLTPMGLTLLLGPEARTTHFLTAEIAAGFPPECQASLCCLPQPSLPTTWSTASPKALDLSPRRSCHLPRPCPLNLPGPTPSLQPPPTSPPEPDQTASPTRHQLQIGFESK